MSGAHARADQPALAAPPALSAAHGAPEPPARTVVTDDRGRVLYAFQPPKSRRSLTLDTSVERFVAWLQDEVDDGWHPTDWIAEYYAWFCDATATEPHNMQAVRSVLAQQPGVLCERKRLDGAEFALLRRVLKIKTNRTRFYYVPSAQEQAEAMADRAAGRDARHGKFGAGARTGSPRKPKPRIDRSQAEDAVTGASSGFPGAGSAGRAAGQAGGRAAGHAAQASLFEAAA